MTNNEIITSVLYKEALAEEIEWRSNTKNAHDVDLFDEMCEKINENSPYNYRNYPDISMRRHEDPIVVDIIASYLGRFDNEGITGELVRSIGTKKGRIATERIINSYFCLSEASKRKRGIFYDEALSAICDKRFTDRYVEMISKPEHARWLWGMMKMLGRWKDEEAKKLMIKYLESSDEDMVNMTVQALKYYKHDEVVISALRLSLTKDFSHPLKMQINKALQFALR